MSNKLIKESDIQKRKKQENYYSDVLRTIIEYVLAVLGIAICLLVPLYLRDGYNNVGVAKYDVYRTLILWGFGVLFLLTLGYLFTLKKDVKPDFFKTDYWVIAFLAFSVIAAFAGGNFNSCIWGYPGWSMGLISMISFGLIYFYFSIFGKGNKQVLACLMAAAMIAFILGILHRFMIDPMGVYADIADTYKNQFLSTLGQATWYSSFVCTVLPFGAGIFWCGKKTWIRVVSGIFTFGGFCTMITQNSDSAYAALSGMLAVLVWFSISDVKRMERFFEVLFLFVTATRFMNIMFRIFPNEILQLDQFSNFLLFDQVMWFGFVLALLLWLFFFVLAKDGKYHVKAARITRNVLFSLLGAVLLLAALHVAASAKGLLPESLTQYTSKIPYLIWSDNWGNGRGRTWAFSLQMFGDMDIFHKLFGVGPDGYAPYAYNLYQDRLVEMWGNRTLTNAHNEWMNAVINYGILGAAAYIGVFLSAIKEFAGKQQEQPVMVGLIACIVSYMCHNFFCYQQVCCTPFIFLLMGVGMYWRRTSR
ncbi:MAG: O-antigen ligase family protein [Lachnospiraceae bacterium]|nr:O-antigen ligase family protein [Lachnospiraceae bacterium]